MVHSGHLGAFIASCCMALTALPCAAQAPDAKLAKVSVSLVYTMADAGIFIAMEKGYFKDQGLDVDLVRMTSAGDAVALLATDKLDVASGGLTPGLLNAFLRGLPIQIVAEKSNIAAPAGINYGGLLVRKDLVDSGQVKTAADLKGRRIGINNVQSPSLNYAMRAHLPAGVGKDQVTFVEIPFNQFVPAMEKKAVDAVLAYHPLVQVITDKMKLGVSLPEAYLNKTSKDDITNLMLYSNGFAKNAAAKKFMVAHLRAQRDFIRMIDKGDAAEACRIVNKYLPTTPPDCGGMTFGTVNPNGEFSIDSLERYQKEWLQWGLMKESANIRQHVNLEFVRHASTVLGPFR